MEDYSSKNDVFGCQINKEWAVIISVVSLPE